MQNSHGFEAILSNFDEKTAKNLSNELEYQLRSIFDTKDIIIKLDFCQTEAGVGLNTSF